MQKTAGWWATMVAAVLVLGVVFWWLRPLQPQDEHALFQGVFYSAQQLPETSESRGLAHLVRIELETPGVWLYNTPLDSQAVAAGDQYGLSYTWWEARRQGLAVAINGTLFRGHSEWFLPGETVRAVHTTIAAGEVSHRNAYTSMIWTDEEGTLHITPESPPPDQVVEEAIWGVGGLLLGREASAGPHRAHVPSQRTLVGANEDTQELWFAVFEDASHAAAWEVLQDAGAQEAVVMDGGGSSTLNLHRTAATPRTGTLVGGWRPVATHVGVYAEPVPRSKW